MLHQSDTLAALAFLEGSLLCSYLSNIFGLSPAEECLTQPIVNSLYVSLYPEALQSTYTFDLIQSKA